MSIQLGFISFFCLLFISITASAEDKNNNIEITPFVGYRFASDINAINSDAEITTNIRLNEDTSYGFLLAWDYDRKRQGELLVSHYTSRFSQGLNLASNDNLAITYVHIGGNVPISDGVVPLFVTGGLGLTHFSPDDSLLSDETRFSFNLGLATKILISEQISLRFGGRVYATLFNSDSQMFCNKQNCAVLISSDLWIQSEVNVGITFSF